MVLSVVLSIRGVPGVLLNDKAMVAFVIARSVVPKALEIRTRKWDPPMVVRIVCRMVEFANMVVVPFC